MSTQMSIDVYLYEYDSVGGLCGVVSCLCEQGGSRDGGREEGGGRREEGRGEAGF